MVDKPHPFADLLGKRLRMRSRVEIIGGDHHVGQFGVVISESDGEGNPVIEMEDGQVLHKCPSHLRLTNRT